MVLSCDKNIDENVGISAEDLAAIDGMDKSYLAAEQYNDSIFICLDFNPICENEYLNSCDSLFHHYADEYENYHHSYSHQNAGDDHHHAYMNQDHHGNGMMGEQNYGHSIESSNQMDSLLVHHAAYH
jgi:hypothetical protein